MIALHACISCLNFRGDMLDGRTQSDGVPPNFSLPHCTDGTMSDVFIAHSTLPGYKSHRDIFEGSWYINCLCKIFMEHAHNKHVESLFIIVNKKMRNIKSGEMTSQTSMFSNVAFNNCYLHPGIYEEEGELKHFTD